MRWGTSIVAAVLMSAAAAADTIPCNTGVVDINGACGISLAPVGKSDPHWLLATPFPSGPSGTPITAAQLGGLSFGPVYANIPVQSWMANGPSSEWLTPSAPANQGELGGQYVYRTTFSAGLSSLTGRYSSDNELVEVFLNGVVVSGFPLNGAADFNIWTSFTIPSGFNTSGINTLDFVVRNRGGGGIDSNPTTTGFRVEFVPSPTIVTTSSQLFGTAGQSYSKQLVATGGSGSYQWAYAVPNNLAQEGLTLNQSTGVISGIPVSGGTFPFNPIVVDVMTQLAATKGLSIGIPQIGTASALPKGTAGVPYSLTFTVTDGPQPSSYQWSATPSTPAGLALDPNSGTLSGAPAAGTSTFNVTAFNGATNTSATKTFTLTINQQLAIVDSSPLPSGTGGVPFSLALRATGGTLPYLFDVLKTPFNPNSLPPGLNLSPAGVLSGTPATPGTYSFTVILTDGAGSQVLKQFMQTINGQPTITTSSPLPPAMVGVPYSQKIDVTGGTPPYLFFISTPPPGLTINPATGVVSGTPTMAGTFTFGVRVSDSQQAGTTMPFQLSVTNASPTLLVSPLSLDFTAAVDGDSPASQQINVSAMGAQPASFSIAIDGGAGIGAPSWLLAKPLSGVTPARVVVRVDQGGMPAGKYTARIKVTDSSQNMTIVLVLLTLSNVAPKLQVLPDQLDFTALIESPGVFERVIAVRNAGGGGPVSFSTSIQGPGSWVTSVTPSSGQTTRNSLVFLRVIANTQGLGVGSYRKELHFMSSAGNPAVRLKLFVAGTGPIIGANVAGVRLQARQGGGFSNNPTVKIFNIGDPATTVNWTAEIVNGSDIVSLSATTGTATAATPGELTIIPKTSALLLAAGRYYAVLRISDPQSRNSPVYVVVLLDLASSTTPALPDPFPAGLFFIAAANGPQPASQMVAVNTSSAAAVPFQAAAVTADGSNWLSATPAVGSSTGQAAGQVTVKANPTGLIHGVYSGEVTISMSGVLRTVTVTLIVLPAGSTPPAGAAAATQASTCPTPSSLVISRPELINSFSVLGTFPMSLIVRLTDDCGGVVNDGSVVAEFSNTDASRTLESDRRTGTYSTTWSPGVVLPQMTVKITATGGTLTPAVFELNGATNPNVAPALDRDGVLNVFNRVLGGALAPGMIAEVYGAGLASGTASTSGLSLPVMFNSTAITVGAYPAPLYFVSARQLDVQIPVELATGRYRMLVTANGPYAVSEQLFDVVPLQYGIAQRDDGSAIAQHGDGSDVTNDLKAKPSEVLAVYVSGMGDTDPRVKSGDRAPGGGGLARVTMMPTVLVDGQIAAIDFAGLVPGLVGLYQINFHVPENARTGNLDLVVCLPCAPAENPVSSNTTTLPVAK